MKKNDEWDLAGQMTIFDYPELLPEEDHKEVYENAEPDFETMSTEAAVQLIQERTGLKFKHNERFKSYIAKKKGYEVEINGFNHYAEGVRDERRFLDIGISKGKWGSGSPIESIDEAVEYIHREIDKCNVSEEKVAEPKCTNAAECEAYQEGCGGTIEPCRFGGPYQWSKEDCKYFKDNPKGICTHDSCIKHIKANRLNLNITCNNGCCYECQDKCRYRCYVVRAEENKKENKNGNKE